MSRVVVEVDELMTRELRVMTNRSMQKQRINFDYILHHIFGVLRRKSLNDCIICQGGVYSEKADKRI